MTRPCILLVTTSATRMTGNDAPTGVWLEEAVAPYYTFLDAGCTITLASPQGGPVPIDPTSVQPENLTASTARYADDTNAQAQFASSTKLSDVALDAYDAIYFPGGHGTMEDLPVDAAVRRAVEHFYAAKKPLASVCHGPACLVNAQKPDGSALIAGHAFTCFTNDEETIVGLADKVPFLLQTTLTQRGGHAQTAAPFAPQVVVSDHLITGQNPASSAPAAKAVLAQLRTKAPR